MSELILVLLPLAQAGTRTRDGGLREAAWWVAGLLVAVLVAFVIAAIIIFVVRSRAIHAETTGSRIPLTLAELRRMHRNGEIDDEEMKTLKKLVTDQAKRDIERPAEDKGE